MFTGDSGIGKSLVAKELLRSLFCETGQYGGCGECRGCRLFDSGNHPDFHERNCLEKEQVAIDALRDLLYSLHLSAYAGTRRAVLFTNTEHLSVQGANLLLKIVEEPRPDIYFCLLTSNPSRLPPTLLSRCHLWFFDRLTQEEILAILEHQGQAQHRTLPLSELAVLADGTMENLASMEAHAEDWQMLRAGLDAMAVGDAAQAGEFAYSLSKDRESLRTRLHLMRLHARTRMLTEQNPAVQASWSVCVTNLIEAEYLIFDRNLGAAYVLGLLFVDLADRDRAQSAPLMRQGRLLEELVV